MGNQRKKSRRTLLKNFEKEKSRLLTLELELSRALEDQYPDLGYAFYKAFEDCPDFNCITADEAEMNRFFSYLRRCYNYCARLQEREEIADTSEKILPTGDG